MLGRLEGYRTQFIEAMDDDLNTADALSSVFELARDINSNLGVAKNPSKELCEAALQLFDELCGVLGILYNRPNEQSLDEEIEELIRQRTEARKKKDFATADRIRDELKARNIVLEDTPQGVKWSIQK